MATLRLSPKTTAPVNHLWRRRAIIIPCVLLILLSVVLLKSRQELGAAVDSTLSADLRWLLFGIGCQAIALTLIAVNYRFILLRLGHRLTWPFMMRAHLRRHVVATVVPLGTPASYVVFARDLAPRGVSGNDAVSAMMLYSAGGQMAFIVFMSATVSWLALHSELPFSMVIVVAAIPVAICWIGLLFYALHKGTAGISRLTFLPSPILRLAQRLAEHDLHPRDLLLPMLFSLGVNFTGIGMLVAALHAVGQQPSLTSLLMIRLVGQLSAQAMPVMAGAGVVELSMVGALQQTGVLAAPAAAAAILFRCAQFWLPLALGVVLFANLPQLRRAATRIAQHLRISRLRRNWYALTRFGRGVQDSAL